MGSNVTHVVFSVIILGSWESSEHLFLHCPYAKIVWEGLSAKLLLQPTQCYSHHELVSSAVDPLCGGFIFVAHLLFPAFV